jgi:proteasome lid subunit RPN8/RPN11
MGMEIVLTRVLLQRLLREAEQALPHECCGLLLGQGTRIDEVRPTANVHPTPTTHFEIEPQALVDAHRAARRGGLPILGYYHSHPNGRGEPSATDRANTAGDRRVWAIVAGGDVTFWRDDEDGFAKLSYIVSER